MSRKVEIGIFITLILFALLFPFLGYLDKPVVWFDEGITIEIARNFALYGKLDVITAPGVFSGFPYLVGTNGYPLTLPLAAFFKVFGVGLFEARVYMLSWFLATIGLVYFVTRKFFGVFSAIASTMLVVSFASFYGNGLTATGEMPGIFFFLLGLWTLVGKKNYFLTGIVWGLAMASKPGAFLLLAHTVVFYVLLVDRNQWFKKLLKAGCGFLIPVMLWILLVFPLTTKTLYSIIEYVVNPIDIPVVSRLLEKHSTDTLYQGLIIPHTQSVTENILRNLKLFVTHSTLIYFSILVIVILISFIWRREMNEREKKVIYILLIYGCLTIFFFIRGPGWLRYLIGLQILIFILLYPAFQRLSTWFVSKLKVYRFERVYLSIATILFLFTMQTFHLYFFSNIPDSKGAREFIADLTGVNGPMSVDKKIIVGLYNVPEVAAFTDPRRTYHMLLPQDGLKALGESPLLMKSPPDIIVINNENLLIGEQEKIILETLYDHLPNIRKFNVYVKKILIK